MAEEKDSGKSGDLPIGYFGISEKFARLNRLITRDLNNYTSKPSFYLYSKDDISKYLSDPYRYEKELRRAVIYMYGASSHFRRLIQYFVSLTDCAYVVEPFNIDPRYANTRTTNLNYRKVLATLSSMNIPTQLPKILTICLREDCCYLSMWETNDNITLQVLPSDYCAISTIEGNVLNVTFDFSYFDSRPTLLEYYPPEFREKYSTYKNNKKLRWIELDSPTSFAIKCNTDILDYCIPPFAGLLRDLYDIEDYRNLKLTKESIENYAMIAMKLPMDDEGNWGIDLNKARDFWSNLDAVLPEEVGSVLTPMDLEKIDFQKSNTGDTDTVTEAENHMFTAAGVSSLLFNNEKASANALVLSIKSDQAITYGIVKSFGDAINRYIQSQKWGKNFRVNFLNVSQYNSKEAGDAYLKAASYGLPMISMYAASQGLGQAELDAMSFLEGQVLGLQDLFRPIESANTMSSEALANADGGGEPGAPEKDIGEVSDSREKNEERE